MSGKAGLATPFLGGPPKPFPLPALAAEEGHVFHVRREIAAQRHTLPRTDAALRDLVLPPAIAGGQRLVLVAEGTALQAAHAARGWVEQLSGLACDVEPAAEHADRLAPLAEGTVGVLVMRGGEADSRAAYARMRERAGAIVAVIHDHAAAADPAALIWPAGAPPEQGLHATESVSAQILALIRLAIAIGCVRGSLDIEALVAAERGLADAPLACALAEAAEPRFAAIATRIAQAEEAVFVGRAWGAALADIGAVMTCRLARIRTAACSAGALIGGDGMDLVEQGSPVIFCAADDSLLTRTLDAARHARARGAWVVMLTEASCAARCQAQADEVVALPGRGLAFMFACLVGIQLLAYHAALALGHPVDRAEAGGRLRP